MKKALRLLLCVDWEGLSLQEENIRALQAFRERWAIPLLHFMNPAYFTSKSLRPQAQALDFSRVIKADDLWGLHLHGAKNFIQACGISFQEAPTFAWAGDQNPGEFYGHEVILNTYGIEDFSQMIATALAIFRDQGWPRPSIFRAGGWMGCPEFYPVLKRWGFWADSSSAPPTVIARTGWQNEPLHRYLKVLWGHLDPFSQPFLDHGFPQIPNNGGAIDYWSQPAHQWARDLARLSDPLAVVTVHQETAAQHLWKLDHLLQELLLGGGHFLNKTKLMSSFLESSLL
jgi:hypothetical protein